MRKAARATAPFAAKCRARIDIVKVGEHHPTTYVRRYMTSTVLYSLETLLAVKQKRLALTRSPRSREVLKREMRLLRHQLDALRAQLPA